MRRAAYAKIEYSNDEIVIRFPIKATVVMVPVMPDLSAREMEVLEAMGPNRSRANKEIARALGMSERTVKFHVSNILHKFGVSVKGEL